MTSVPGCLGSRRASPIWLLQGHPSPTGRLPLASPAAESVPPQPLHAAPAPATPTAGVFLAWKSATKS